MIAPDNHAPGIKRLAIVGAGLTGWTTALALAKGLHGLGIEIVIIDHPTHNQQDLQCEAAIPACVTFHQWLGLDEKELVAATGAGFQLATHFNAWSGPQQNYFMPYSDHGFILNRIEFPHYVIGRHLQGHRTHYDDYSLAAVAARHGRFCHPSAQESSLFSTLNYGFSLNSPAYTDYLREFALQLNVVHLVAEIDAIQQNHEGSIASIRLKDINNSSAGLTANGVITADFYLDCSGAQGELINKILNIEWQSQASLLPITHVISHTQTLAATQALPSHRELRTAAAGWIQTLSSQTHTEQQYFYCADFTSSEQAHRESGATENALIKRLYSGRRASFWYNNCLALGEAAGNLGVMGAGNLHLVQSAVLRFLNLFPAQLPAALNAAEFNRLTHLEYDHIEDFHRLHYQLAASNQDTQGDTGYWRNIHTTPHSERLTCKLELFKQRGLIPFYEGETFSAGVWTSLLLGNDFWPERTNPLIYTMDVNWVEQQLAAMKNLMRTAADAMPTQAIYLRQ